MTAPTMTDARNPSQDTSAACEVGYGKPPRHTQFRKGQSGNPGGRPRRPPVQRANALLLAEAYRCVAIKEDGRMVPVTALQAILRSQIELAINGNYRAQRDILIAVQHLECLKSIGEYRETNVDDEPDVEDETDVDDETDEAGESGEEDESRDADETGEGGEEDETKPAAQNAGNPSPSSGRVDASAASGRVGMTQHRSVAPPGAHGATLPHSLSKTGVNALMDGEGGGGDETGSDGAGAALTAAPDPAPPPDTGRIAWRQAAGRHNGACNGRRAGRARRRQNSTREFQIGGKLRKNS